MRTGRARVRSGGDEHLRTHSHSHSRRGVYTIEWRNTHHPVVEIRVAPNELRQGPRGHPACAARARRDGGGGRAAVRAGEGRVLRHCARARGRERNQTTDQSARGGRGKNQRAVVRCARCGGGSEIQMGLVSGGAEGVLYI